MTAQNYITALWLIAYLPKVAYLYVRENWKMLATVAACLFVLFLVSYNFGKTDGGTVATSAVSAAEYDGGGFGFVDLTAAFATGEKRTMQVELIAIHHTAGNPNGTVSDICRVHLGQNKWNSVGYHFFITPDGTTYQLRPLDERVPHAFGCNDNGIAICLAGNFSEYEVPPAQRDAALQLTRWLMRKYNLGKSNVLTHSECRIYSPLNNTECCGTKFNANKFREKL